MPEVPTILVVEDNEDDAWLVGRALEKVGAKNHIEIVRDGEQAVMYLAGEEKYADRELFPIPGLVLLDLKMPLRDGFEVLQWIREHRELAGLPVVVLTISEWASDVKRAYDSGANSYVVKPMEFDEFTAAIGMVKTFWLDRVKMR